MKKWSNLRNTELGRYKLSTMVLAALLAASLLWQGVFAMLGTTGVDADAFALLEAFGADIGDGLQEQRAGAWLDAVENPATSGGVWGQFWENAQFGAVRTSASIPNWPNVPDPGLTSVFMDSLGIVWRVIAEEGDSRLIMTEHVRMLGTQYNTTNVYRRLSQSHLRAVLNSWGDLNLAPELAARARTPNNVDNDVRSAHSTGHNMWREENGAAGWTSPGAAAVNAPGALFVLSVSEVNRYAAAVGTTNAERRTSDLDGRSRHWWLRSPGGGSPVAHVSNNGEIGSVSANFANATQGVRPALWISI